MAENGRTMATNGSSERGKESEENAPATPVHRVFLRPIAPPAALGLAGFSGSTFIVSMWIAGWWGDAKSPTIFFPFIGVFGGLAQFIAGIYGFLARDTLVSVINTMWGSFWIALAILYAFVAAGAIPPHSVYIHFPELAAWFVVLAAITWSGAIAATARDLTLCVVLFSLAIGTTIACCLFAFNPEGIRGGIKAAAYFWMVSSLAAWWRVTCYMMEEAYGKNHPVHKFFPIGRLPREKEAPYVNIGTGEPGVKRGAPGTM